MVRSSTSRRCRCSTRPMDGQVQRRCLPSAPRREDSPMTTTVASAVVTAASSGLDEAIGNDAQLLRDRVLEHLRQQGFRFANNRLLAPFSAAKGEIARYPKRLSPRSGPGPGRRWRATKDCLSTSSPAAALSMSLPFSPALVPVSDYRGFEG